MAAKEVTDFLFPAQLCSSPLFRALFRSHPRSFPLKLLPESSCPYSRAEYSLGSLVARGGGQ